MRQLMIPDVIKRARRGRQDAIGELYEATKDYAYFVARRYLKNAEDIADVLQDAYISAFANLHTFDDERPFEPWLYAIVSRKCLSFIKGKRAVVLSYDEVENYVADAEEMMPDRWLEQAEKRREVLQIIDGLPEKQRVAITLFYFERLEISEIARIMGVRAGTVNANLFHGRKNMKDEIIAREEKAGALYLRPAMTASRLAKLYELEAASAVIPAELSDAVWSVVIAADKADIRKWFGIGAERGYKYMLVVSDRMDYPDYSDSPYYCDGAESVYEQLRAFRHDPMCEVMEVYDLAADMEAQLDEKRAWNLPDLPDGGAPEAFLAYEPLSSGEARLAFMERRNAEYIKEYFGESTNAAANPLRLFTDDARQSVFDICVYILEQSPVTKTTAAAVYRFKPDGGASAHSALLTEACGDDKSDVLIPLPHHYSVEVDEPYITLRVCYAHGKDLYSPVYRHWVKTETLLLMDDFDGLGTNSGSSGVYDDKDSHENYMRAMELMREGAITKAADLLYKAANEGHADAMLELGNHYAARHDAEKAAHWYKLAELLRREAGEIE